MKAKQVCKTGNHIAAIAVIIELSRLTEAILYNSVIKSYIYFYTIFGSLLYGAECSCFYGGLQERHKLKDLGRSFYKANTV